MVTFLTSKLGIVLCLVAVCLIALAVIARNWSCREQKHRNPILGQDRHYFGQVASIEGVGFTMQSGRRTYFVQNAYVVINTTLAAPAGKMVEELLPVGSNVSVCCEGRNSKLFSAPPDDEPEAVEGVLEARPPRLLIGVVQSQNGVDVGLALLKAGFARCGANAPDYYKSSEKEKK